VKAKDVVLEVLGMVIVSLLAILIITGLIWCIRSIWVVIP